jgi:hypothetical protein
VLIEEKLVLKLLSNEFNIKDYMQIQTNGQKMHDLIFEFPPALIRTKVAKDVDNMVR